MADTNEILARGKRVLIGNYARLPVVMTRGEGCWLWDSNNTRYLDLFAGFGGCILGHCHPALITAATEQAQRLWHVGNTFYTEPQIEFAERLNRHAFVGKAFFCHGGADANESAVKLARLCGSEKSPAKWKIITLAHSFHGRTLAMIAATGNPAVKAGFAPDTPGFSQVPANDFDALQAAVSDETAGIMLEPIQGEGGINLYSDDYIARVRKLCDERGILLIFDEVWSGGGRTGRWFGYQYFHDARGNPITPDIMTLGKAIGGGLPVGAMFAKPDAADRLVPGKHGSTLGGNPICMAVARTVFDVIEKEDLTTHAARLGEHAIARLRNELGGKVEAVRGRGLMLGIELSAPPEKLVEKGLERGVVINLTAKKVVRLAPAINIDAQDWDRGLDTVVALIKGL
jgi:acetylornithine/N-succinyldiaminopimelate aminotransferase